ncbi:MAG: hypothetical protein MUE40_18760 [Anaerolineae bacterium]|jgi:hypothetical protein|nr:hypothetical protein [Anaerolineae bacterium]
MTIDWTRILPVLVSIGVIIAVAVLRQYSKTIAAIAAVMPINIPLTMWIVYSSAEPELKQASLNSFTTELTINLLPTFIFTLVAWQMVKAGYGLLPAIAAGYLAWAIGLGLIFFVRNQMNAAA